MATDEAMAIHGENRRIRKGKDGEEKEGKLDLYYVSYDGRRLIVGEKEKRRD